MGASKAWPTNLLGGKKNPQAAERARSVRLAQSSRRLELSELSFFSMQDISNRFAMALSLEPSFSFFSFTLGSSLGWWPSPPSSLLPW